LKLEDMDYHMADSQFMVQVLNSLTNDIELQMVLIETIIGNKENLWRNDELQEVLSLRYERLSLVAETNYDIDLTKEKTLFTNQFKGRCQNRRNMCHKGTDYKARRE
jgi:hypothetical protein